MGIKRYKAGQDSTITNAFKFGMTTRGTGSNMGNADVVEIFSLYGQKTTSSVELSRALVQFPVDTMISDRDNEVVGGLSNVKFYLRLYNARHAEQLPKNLVANVMAVSRSWQEGTGLDMIDYDDLTKDTIDGSNWINASSNFTAATATLVLQGGANLAALDAKTFTLTDAEGNVQTFTIDYDGTSLTDGAIGFDGDSNTTHAIDSIKTAINNVTSLKITAGTAAAAGDADSQMTLPLTQDTTGYRGNSEINVDTNDHITATNFSGGTGQWANIGGDFYSSSYTSGSTMPTYTYTFENGHEDLLLDVTNAVEEWIAGNSPNYGFGIFITSSQEGYHSSSTGKDDGALIHNTVGARKSFYTKRFFSRTSENFFLRPVIEARWDSRVTDDRGNFYASSSVASAQDNINNLYLYNYIRGTLKDIPKTGTETISVKLYESSDGAPDGSVLATWTASKVSTGVYKASGVIDTALTTLNDVWVGSIGGEYKTGSVTVKDFNDTCVRTANDYFQYTTKITNLKSAYRKNEKAKFRVFARPRNFSPTIYTVASTDIEKTIIPSASYEILRTIDQKVVINNSTGSNDYETYLSYDNSGSYFDLDLSMLQSDYMYTIKLFYHISGDWREQEDTFKFRVEDN